MRGKYMLYMNKNRNISTQEWDNIFEKLNLKEKLSVSKTIVIKPNFAAGTYVDPKTHVITNLELLSSAIEYFVTVNKDAKIYIAESDSTGYGFAYLKFKHLKLPESLGLSKIAQKQVELLDLSRDTLQKYESRKLKRYTSIDRQLWLSETLMNADLKVNLSNLKTHAVTGYTGACKNLFGCLPDMEKYHNHPYIHEVIHDLVLAIKPDLNVIDAFYGMEKNGPVQGIDVDTGYRIFSNNAIEADIYASSSIGYSPKKVKYIKLLCKTSKIDIKSQSKVITAYKKPGMFLRVMNKIGLVIQKFGLHLETFGHRIHSCPTFMILIITIVRPILLKIFDYEKLKKWKRKVLK